MWRALRLVCAGRFVRMLWDHSDFSNSHHSPLTENGVLQHHQWQSVSTPPENSAAGDFGL